MTALEPITGPSVWHGGELTRRGDWTIALDAGEVAELEAAARAMLDRDLIGLASADLPLPRLDARLNEMRDAVVEGCGFALMRGLPVEEWPREGRRARLLGHRLAHRPARLPESARASARPCEGSRHRRLGPE